MADSYVDAAKSGADIAQSIENYGRKRDAYNALRSVYGAVAGDPDANAKLFNTYAAQQKLPGELTAQSLSNQTSQQSLDYNALANPLRIQAAKLGLTSKQQDIDQATQMNPLLVDQQRIHLLVLAITLLRQRVVLALLVDQQRQQNAQAQQMDPLRVQQAQQNISVTGAKLGDEQAERERTAAQGILASVKQQIANGVDPGAAFDAIAPQIAAHENVRPEVMQQLRQRFVADPQGTIKAFDDYMGAAHPNTQLMQAQAQLARAQQAGGGKGAAADPQAQADAFALASQRAANGIEMVDKLTQKGGMLDKAYSGLGNLAPVRSYLAHKAEKEGLVLNQDTENARAGLDQLKHSLALLDVQSLKAGGVTLGVLTDRKFKAASEALANLSLNQSKPNLQFALGKAREYFEAAKSDMLAQSQRARAKATGGGVSPTPIKPTPATGPNPAGPTFSADDFVRMYGGGK